MKNDRDLQAPWVGKSDWDYLGWKTEEEEREEELLYDDYIDRLIDKRREDEALRELESQNGKEQ